MHTHNLHRGLRSGVLFLVLVAVTFRILLRGQDIGALAASLSGARLPMLGVGVACMVCFLCCEAKNLQTGLSIYGSSASFSSCLGYALIGFFFSSVTPSASGGQPMQLYAMHRDGHSGAAAALALLAELACFQTAGVFLAVLGFVLQREPLLQINGHLRLLLLVGAALNLCILLVILWAVFSKRLAPALWSGLMVLFKALHFRKAEQWKQKGNQQLEEFRRCALCLRTHKRQALQMFITSIIQLSAYHSIPFWVYTAFYLKGESLPAVIGLQAVLFIAVSSLPFPGAVGISEGGFLLLYKTLFPDHFLKAAMLLSRGISFYLFVLISGLFVSAVLFRAGFSPKTPQITPSATPPSPEQKKDAG